MIRKKREDCKACKISLVDLFPKTSRNTSLDEGIKEKQKPVKDEYPLLLNSLTFPIRKRKKVLDLPRLSQKRTGVKKTRKKRKKKIFLSLASSLGEVMRRLRLEWINIQRGMWLLKSMKKW